MPVTEFERHQLFTWFEEHMGPERAKTMMDLVPPVGWADVATRRDLDHLDAKIDALEARVDARINALEARLDARIDALEARLDARLAELRSDLLRTFGTWLFASQAVVIAAVSVLVAIG